MPPTKKKPAKKAAPAARGARKGKPVVQRKAATSHTWMWWAALGAILGVGLLVIVVSRGGGSGSGGNAAPPDGVESFDNLTRSHVDSAVAYPQTPPVGGDHAGTWLNCGVYESPVRSENAVHSMEHGAVWVTYDPSLSPAEVTSLRNTVTSHFRGRSKFVILSPFPGLPAKVVASAWGRQLKMESPSDPRLGQFIDAFREGPQTPEPGASCDGGIGSPVA